jgi:hypothetical protein
MIKEYGLLGSRGEFGKPGFRAQTGPTVYAIQYESYGS